MIMTCSNCGFVRVPVLYSMTARCPKCGSDKYDVKPCVEGPLGDEGQPGILPEKRVIKMAAPMEDPRPKTDEVYLVVCRDGRPHGPSRQGLTKEAAEEWLRGSGAPMTALDDWGHPCKPHRIQRYVPAAAVECVNGRAEHGIWYPWHWSQERGRWERECAVMGCLAWQHAKTAKISGKVVSWASGKAHAHLWGVWYPVDEHHVEDNLFYERNCACGAEERGEDLKVEEPFEFFDHPRNRV